MSNIEAMLATMQRMNEHTDTLIRRMESEIADTMLILDATRDTSVSGNGMLDRNFRYVSELQ